MKNYTEFLSHLNLNGLSLKNTIIDNDNYSIKNQVIIKDLLKDSTGNLIPDAAQVYLNTYFLYVGDEIEIIFLDTTSKTFKQNKLYTCRKISNEGEEPKYQWEEIPLSSESSSQHIYFGDSEPDSTLGNVDDVYFKYNKVNYFVMESDTDFTFTYIENIAALEYSIDGSTWNNVVVDTAITTTNKYLYLRGKDNTAISNSSSTSSVFKFSGATNLKLDGDIMCMFDYENPESVIPATSAMSRLFWRNTALVSISDTVFANYMHPSEEGCLYLFGYCTNLTTGPTILPAVDFNNKQGVYRSMFTNCKKLKNMAELPCLNLTPYCYEDMYGRVNFDPDKIFDLPAPLVEGCYQEMFSRATFTTKVPVIYGGEKIDVPKYALASMFSQALVKFDHTDSGHTDATKIFTCGKVEGTEGTDYGTKDMLADTLGMYMENPTEGVVLYSYNAI